MRGLCRIICGLTDLPNTDTCFRYSPICDYWFTGLYFCCRNFSPNSLRLHMDTDETIAFSPCFVGISSDSRVLRVVWKRKHRRWSLAANMKFYSCVKWNCRKRWLQEHLNCRFVFFKSCMSFICLYKSSCVGQSAAWNASKSSASWEVHHIFGNRRFIAVFTQAFLLFLSWAR